MHQMGPEMPTVDYHTADRRVKLQSLSQYVATGIREEKGRSVTK